MRLIDVDNQDCQEAIGRMVFRDRQDIRDLINVQPTINAEPVVYTKWVRYPDCGVTCCPVCGWSIEECWESKRCPECGAHMMNGG